MTTLREAAQQALEALESLQGGCTDSNDGTVEAITVWCPEVIDALRAALAQQEQEPVAWWIPKAEQFCMAKHDGSRPFAKAWEPLYTTTHRREWRGLTEEEIADAQDAAAIQFRKSRHGVRGQQLMPSDSPDWWLARAVEAALKEKNNG